MGQVKNRNCDYHHWILNIQISLGTKFQFKLTILIFLTKFALKGFFQSKMENIGISVGIKFQLTPIILFFWTKFAQKGYFLIKNTKSESHLWIQNIGICLVIKFQVKWQFWFFGLNWPKRSISGLKQKYWTSPLNSSCLN